jgi:hypothetical protein
MRELIRTNDTVLIGYVEVLLKDAGISAAVVDANMSAVEGSIGILPRRVLVMDDDWPQAKRVLDDADLGRWVAEKDEEA